MKNLKNKPHLLLYAHYYYPDVASTGQLLSELVEGISKEFLVTVICVVPSYMGKIEKKYKKDKYYMERLKDTSIIRVRVPAFDKTRKISRIRNILTYMFRAMWATFKVGKVDYIMSISQPPILGGLLGVWGKWLKRSKYIYNIQDFNPEQVITSGYSKNKFIIKSMLFLDKFSCKCADKVIVVGRDMIKTLEKRFYGNVMPEYACINNWIDEKKIYPLPTRHPKVAEFRKKYGLEGKFVFMYSGNLGLYYDLENLIKVIEKAGPAVTADGREVIFAFVGAGCILPKLVSYVEKHHLDYVVFIPYQDKDILNYSLNGADVHWCVSAAGNKGVSCPSKFYGIAAAGKPVLGVMEKGAECRIILEEAGCGLVCDPGDYRAIQEQIKWFINHSETFEFTAMGERGRRYLVNKLTKEASVKRYINEILSC